MTSSNEKTSKAVKELLARQDATDYIKELSVLHSGFLRSDFADDKRTRILVTATYENIRDFIIDIKSVDRKDL